MNSRTAKPFTGQKEKQLHSQIGFYRLPPGYQAPSNKRVKRTKRSQKYASSNRPIQRRDRAWASNNELDAIVEEVSEESAISSPGPSRGGSPHTNGLDLRRRSSSYDDLKNIGESFWNSSPTSRLIGSKTPEPGLFGKHANKSFQNNDNLRNDYYINNMSNYRGPIGRRDSISHQVTSKNDFFEKCFHPHGKICHNIKYNLHQLRKHSQKGTYMNVVDAICMGPETVRASEAERILGINQEVFLKCKAKRKEDAGIHESEATDLLIDEMENLDLNPPSNSNSLRHSKKNKYKNQIQQYGLRELFSYYARWGDPYSTGHHITLGQAEKWLSQAGIVDNWNVTTTDTALSFRKISRGSKWIDYDTFKHFLEEFAWRKRINYEFMVEKLCSTGKPSPTKAYPKDERDNRRGGNSRSGPDPFYVLPPNDSSYYR